LLSFLISFPLKLAVFLDFLPASKPTKISDLASKPVIDSSTYNKGTYNKGLSTTINTNKGSTNQILNSE